MWEETLVSTDLKDTWTVIVLVTHWLITSLGYVLFICVMYRVYYIVVYFDHKQFNGSNGNGRYV